MTQPVLDIQQLHLSFPGFNGDVHALNNVSLQINRGEIVGLVGESGSGKSVTAMLIMRLLPTGSYCVHRGQISLLGDDVLNAREKTASSMARRTSGDDLSGTDDRPQSDTSNRSSDDGRDPPSSTNKSSGSQS
ncbi:D-ala-D-ala transporter subunit DdpD [Escherichia coli]|nr:D-ala-D-ala transporter subunit DdpD [Escherichia coli]